MSLSYFWHQHRFHLIFLHHIKFWQRFAATCSHYACFTITQNKNKFRVRKIKIHEREKLRSWDLRVKRYVSACWNGVASVHMSGMSTCVNFSRVSPISQSFSLLTSTKTTRIPRTSANASNESNYICQVCSKF